MTLSLRQVVDDADLPPFEFEDMDGKPRELPHMKTLTSRQAMTALDGDLELALRGDPDRGIPGIAPDLADLMLDLPNVAVERLFQEWMAHSGIELDGAPGKSPARSRSSATTPTRSTRTSRSAGSRSKR